MASETKRSCKVHYEEEGVIRPAISRDRELGWLCAECAADVSAARGHERRDAAAYAYACGERE